MPRQRAKVDDNHVAVVKALRDEGGDRITVVSLAATGKGVPDLLIGIDGVTHLAEVKDGDKPPSRRQFTPDQIAWFEAWRGASVLAFLSPEHARSWARRLLS